VAELGVSPPTSLYPQPPQGGGALTPSGALDLLSGVIRNTTQMKELNARNAIGQAYQKSIQPDGTFDQPGFNAMIRDNPDAAWMAGEALPHALDIARSQTGNMLQQNQAVMSLFGSLPPNASDEQIRNTLATASRIFKGQNSAVLTAIGGDLLSKRGQSRASAIADLTAQARGPEAGAAQVTTTPGPGGAPQTTSSAAQLRAQQTGIGATPVGQAPGEAELQTSSAAGAANLEATGPKTNQIHADLENLRQLNKDIPLQGPTAEWEKKLNQVGARLGLPVTMTRDQLAKSEEFDKISNQLSLNQSTLFHGSDAGLHTVVAANPNLGMSRYGREGVIDMLQGNQDAIDRTRQSWFNARRAGAPANSYNDFINQSSKAIDPRIFQFNRMSAENQKKFAQDMDPADVDEFKRKYRKALDNGWVKPPKSAQTMP
jgi:hypothetical protein